MTSGPRDSALRAARQAKTRISDNPAIRDFLKREKAKSVTVPYRANRAVVFDSDLFHETDKIAFKEGYLNRRINVTLLYGRREKSGDAPDSL